MSAATLVAYPPLDAPKSVADGLWVVDGQPLRAGGVVPIPVRMTVARLATGELWLHSPTKLTPALWDAVSGLGPIGHLVAPNIAHWVHLKDWQARVPQARTWAAPGLRKRWQVRFSGLRLDEDLGSEPPEAWRGELDQALLRGGLGVTEVAFLHRASRTLILTDLVENFEPEKLPLPMRPLVRAAGAMAPDGMAAAHYRLAMRLNRAEVKAAAQRMLDWEPERVVFAHGKWFEADGTAQLRRSLRWLIG